MPGHVAKAKTRRRERQMKVNVVLRAGKPEGEVGCHIIVVPILKLNLQFPELQLPILPGPVTPGITARPAAAENRRDKWFLCAAGRARATVLPGKGGHTTTTHAHAGGEEGSRPAAREARGVQKEFGLFSLEGLLQWAQG